MIKFSIITVCLNAGEDLIRTVVSALSQTYKNLELIVKDGHSNDGSLQRLPHDPRLRIIEQDDSGIYDAMNQATAAAAGDYLIYMNAGDTFYADTTLEELAGQITQPYAALYYGRCYNEALDVFSNAPMNLTPLFCYRTMLCHQAMVFERGYMQKKMYDCSYRVCADREVLLDLVMRAQQRTQYIPTIIARYKGVGFCETEENRKISEAETKRLREQYFTKRQRIEFRFKIALTLPRLRKRIAADPKFVKVYKRAVGLLYGNKGAENAK